MTPASSSWAPASADPGWRVSLVLTIVLSLGSTWAAYLVATDFLTYWLPGYPTVDWLCQGACTPTAFGVIVVPVLLVALGQGALFVGAHHDAGEAVAWRALALSLASPAVLVSQVSTPWAMGFLCTGVGVAAWAWGQREGLLGAAALALALAPVPVAAGVVVLVLTPRSPGPRRGTARWEPESPGSTSARGLVRSGTAAAAQQERRTPLSDETSRGEPSPREGAIEPLRAAEGRAASPTPAKISLLHEAKKAPSTTESAPRGPAAAGTRPWASATLGWPWALASLAAALTVLVARAGLGCGFPDPVPLPGPREAAGVDLLGWLVALPLVALAAWALLDEDRRGLGGAVLVAVVAAVLLGTPVLRLLGGAPLIWLLPAHLPARAQSALVALAALLQGLVVYHLAHQVPVL